MSQNIIKNQLNTIVVADGFQKAHLYLTNVSKMLKMSCQEVKFYKSFKYVKYVGLNSMSVTI
jgi:hypothetical protein